MCKSDGTYFTRLSSYSTEALVSLLSLKSLMLFAHAVKRRRADREAKIYLTFWAIAITCVSEYLLKSLCLPLCSSFSRVLFLLPLLFIHCRVCCCTAEKKLVYILFIKALFLKYILETGFKVPTGQNFSIQSMKKNRASYSALGRSTSLLGPAPVFRRDESDFYFRYYVGKLALRLSQTEIEFVVSCKAAHDFAHWASATQTAWYVCKHCSIYVQPNLVQTFNDRLHSSLDSLCWLRRAAHESCASWDACSTNLWKKDLGTFYLHRQTVIL